MNNDDQSDGQAPTFSPLVPLIINVLQTLHWFVVGYSLLGWLANSKLLLTVYLIYLPALMIQWFFNKNSCVINNIESKLKTGNWRIEGNPEEGGFVKTALLRIFGWAPSDMVFEVLIRSVMVVLWFVALYKLLGLS